MARYVVETSVPPGASGSCSSLEWRVRAVVGELRRQGLAVFFERAVEPPEDGRCLFFLHAATSREAVLAAERACLDGFRVVEATSARSERGVHRLET